MVFTAKVSRVVAAASSSVVYLDNGKSLEIKKPHPVPNVGDKVTVTREDYAAWDGPKVPVKVS